MRTTVGPLPSAVYWRRRAVVLGATLLGVLILFFACTGGNDPKARPGAGPITPGPGSSAGGGALGGIAPSEDPSFEDARPPGSGPNLPAPSDAVVDPADDGSGGDGTGDGTGPGVPAPGGSGQPDVNVAAAAGQCTDAEVSVTPVPVRTAARRGTPIEILLKIKNISTRTCARDVGSDLQEIYVKQGARKVWSSDTCSTAKGSDLKQFPSGAEREYRVTWNGRQSTRCSTGLAVGPVPAAGEYAVFGRLGGKVSDPVRLSLSA